LDVKWSQYNTHGDVASVFLATLDRLFDLFTRIIACRLRSLHLDQDAGDLDCLYAKQNGCIGLFIRINGYSLATWKDSHIPTIAHNASAKPGSCRKNIVGSQGWVRTLFYCTASPTALPFL